MYSPWVFQDDPTSLENGTIKIVVLSDVVVTERPVPAIAKADVVGVLVDSKPISTSKKSPLFSIPIGSA